MGSSKGEVSTREVYQLTVDFAECEVYELKKVSNSYQYVDGKKTDEINGYIYSVMIPDFGTMYNVNVKSDKPIITNDELRDLIKSKQKQFVSFTNKEFYAHKAGYGKAQCRAIADSIKII